MKDRNAADLVAIILAAGLSLALLLMTAATIYAIAVTHAERGLGENGTQVLTGLTGGIIGVLGAYVGYRFGAKRRDDDASG